MKKISALLCFTAVIALIPAIAQATIWKTYSDAALGFSLDVPGGAMSPAHNPSRAVDKIQQTAYGPVTSSQIRFGGGRGRGIVVAETFPAAARSADPNVLAEAAIEEIIRSQEGQAPERSSFDVTGGAGREARFVPRLESGLSVSNLAMPVVGNRGDVERVRVYYRWPHLYVIAADADEGTDRVFDTFRLLDQSGAHPRPVNLARE